MNSFVEKFKDEVNEYCERLESGLLHLEHEPENYQIIDEIFRIMHSMKGSGGMFGFDLLSDVTHDLESLYDIFRSKKRPIDSEVISFTLNSIDGLHNLMVVSPGSEHHLLAEKMKFETKRQIARFTDEQNSSSTENSSDTDHSVQSNFNQNTWYISFVPNKDILKNGTNPLYLIDELNALGECNIQVNFDKLPALSEMNPEYCYVSWSLFIATTENIETLRDVFIFVTDQAGIQLEKVASQNVLQDEAVLTSFLNAKLNHEIWETIESEMPKPDIQEDETEEIGVLLKSSVEIPKNSVFAQTTVDSIRVDSQKIDQYLNIVSELITAQSRLEVIALKLNHPDLEVVTENFGKLSRQLRDNAFDMSLIPLESVAVRFKRLIHDLSKSLEKEVVLVTEGMETELDKNIIEKLIEPLLHIIRNSMDHGIENKDERLAKQKAAIGTLLIKASTAGSHVLIEIEDDGAGLDLAKIRKKAIEKGIINDQSRLNDEEIAQFIFEPGFTTSELVTDVSGRGVGMDVVKKRIQEMRGMIELSTEKDRFTRISIKLPLSLSIIDGLLTRVGDGYYVIPSSVIKKIHFIKHESLKNGFRQVVELEGVQLPYLNMYDEFVGDGNTPEDQLVVVVGLNNQLFGLVVDEVIHEYQAVIKPLGRLLKGQNAFSGASILGTGQLALVIDTNKMIKKYS
ncbi:MAG: chemotaxis protein CheA [Bacteroidota bacterium]|nr:chemotaxis protein CheA [Odoribacter sp.]MDP3643979.1 chemotaxis protein CheA [Bacteroidota bacterium]